MKEDVMDKAVVSPQAKRMGRRLLDMLKKEMILQHRLLATATQMREAIVERHVVELGALQQHYAELVTSAERMAAERMDLSHAIVRVHHLPTAQVTISQVAECCPPELALLIGAMREMLLEIATEVQSAQTLNRQLLENELDYIGASLEVLARAAAPRRDYAQPLQRMGTPAIMLDKAA